jgi:hypothetical protein
MLRNTVCSEGRKGVKYRQQGVREPTEAWDDGTPLRYEPHYQHSKRHSAALRASLPTFYGTLLRYVPHYEHVG